MKRQLLSALAALGLSVVSFAQASQAGGALTLVTGATDDSFTVEVGPTPGRVQVFGALTVPDGRVFTGVTSLIIRTNLGNDKVNVKVESTSIPSIDINTGEGFSEVDVDLKVAPTPSAASTLRVVGGSTLDKVMVQIDSAAASLSTNWFIDGRGGLNEGVAFIQSNDPSALCSAALTLLGGADMDKWEVLANTKASTLRLNMAGSLGAGMDSFLLKAGGNGATSAFLASTLDMGADADTMNIEMIEVASTAATGQWSAGAGDDLLSANFAGGLTGSATFNMGDGADLALFNAGRWAASLRLLMGAGDDMLEMNSVQTPTGATFSDGGLGFDSFKGFGSRAGFEQIN